MNTKRTSKILAVILSLIMVIGIMPVTAFAVSDFYFYDLTAPIDGIAADYSADVQSYGFSFSRIVYSIIDEDGHRQPVLNYVGKAGDQIQIAVEIKSTSGKFGDNCKATWNGIESSAVLVISENTKTFVFNYTVPVTLKTVSATVTKPVKGAHPDFNPISDDSSKYTVTLKFWYIEDGSNSHLNSTDVFIGGESYHVRIQFKPKDGYTFDKSTVFYVNGDKIIGNVADGSQDPVKDVGFYVPREIIDSSNATVPEPVAGNHPDFNPISGDSDKYTVKIVNWYLVESYNITMRLTDVFEAGKKYCVTVDFTPNDEYKFNDSTKFTINSDNNSKKTLQSGDTYGIEKTFTLPAEVHTHTPSTVWTTDATNHWHTCSGCTELLDKAAHTFGKWTIIQEPTETTKGVGGRSCTVCGFQQTTVIPMSSHTHSFNGTWVYDETNHWQLCSCGEEGNVNAHTYGEWTVTTPATTQNTGTETRTCSVCGATETRAIPKLETTTAPTTKPITEPTTKPSTETTTKPTTEPTTKPSTEPTTKPSTEPTTKPSTEPTTKPSTEPTTKPSTEPTTKPSTEPTTKPSTETTTVPDTNPSTETTTVPVTEPTTKPVTEELTTELTFMLGDVNGDGKVTASDARLALRISASLETATDIQLLAADVDESKKITASDARTILRVSAELAKF